MSTDSPTGSVPPEENLPESDSLKPTSEPQGHSGATEWELEELPPLPLDSSTDNLPIDSRSQWLAQTETQIELPSPEPIEPVAEWLGDGGDALESGFEEVLAAHEVAHAQPVESESEPEPEYMPDPEPEPVVPVESSDAWLDQTDPSGWNESVPEALPVDTGEPVDLFASQNADSDIISAHSPGMTLNTSDSEIAKAEQPESPLSVAPGADWLGADDDVFGGDLSASAGPLSEMFRNPVPSATPTEQTTTDGILFGDAINSDLSPEFPTVVEDAVPIAEVLPANDPVSSISGTHLPTESHDTELPTGMQIIQFADGEEIDLANLPQLDPTSPGSGWLDMSTTHLPGPVNQQQVAPSGGPSSEVIGGSDMLSGPGGSDVIRGLFPSSGPASNIFNDEGPGSSLYDRNSELTEAVPHSALPKYPESSPSDGGSGDIFAAIQQEADRYRPSPSDVQTGAPSGSDVLTSPPSGASGSRVGTPTTVMGDDDRPNHQQAIEQLFAELGGELSSVPRLGSATRPSAAGAGVEGTPDFNEVDASGSGSNLFADSTSPDFEIPGDSGVDLLGALQGPQSGIYSGPKSSIFADDAPEQTDEDDADDAGMVDVNEIPLMGSSDEATEAFQIPDSSPRSDIFAREAERLSDIIGDSTSGAAEHGEGGRISFDMPRRNPLTEPDAAEIAQASGMIDWSLPADMQDDLPHAPMKSDGGNVFSELPRDSGVGASQVSLEFPEGLSDSRQPSPIRPSSRPSIDDLMLPPDAPDLPPPSMIGMSPAAAAAQAAAVQAAATRDAVRNTGRFAPQPAVQQQPTPYPYPAQPTPYPTHPTPEPITVRRGGWLAGTAAGLLVGIGASAAAYFGGIIPEPGGSAKVDPGKGLISSPGTELTVPAPTVSDAQKWLAAGNPADAIKVLQDTPRDAAPDVQAARGQARWLARVRELSVAGTDVKADDQALKTAADDLAAVVNRADKLPDADKPAAVQAALHLGLLKEVTGDTAAAAAIYTRAAAQFPDARPVFDAALDRIKAMTPPTGGNKGAMLTPRQANDLAHAVVIAAVLLQAPEPANPLAPKPAPDEAGLYYWKAINAATAGKYVDAITAITEARKLHDARRLAMLGQGLNPKTDPLEQIFLRTCDDLKDYWTLRQQLYTHPKFGEALAKDGPKKLLDTLAEDSKKYTDQLRKLDADRNQLMLDMRRVSEDIIAAGKKLKDAETVALKLTTERDTATKGLETTKKDLDSAKKSLEDNLKKLTDAETKATDATMKLKVADDTLAVVVKELRATGVLGEKDDPKEKLPKVMKDVAAAAASSDVKKAAEALASALKQTEAVKLDLKKATEDTEKARVATKEAMVAAEKQIKDTMAVTEKQILAIKTESDKKLADQAAKATEAQKTLMAKVQTEMEARAADAMKFKTELEVATKKAATDLDTTMKKAAADLVAQADTLKKEYAATIDTLKTTAAKDVAKLTADFTKETAELKSELATADDKRKAELKEQADKYQVMVAQARDGIRLPVSAAERAARERAAKAFSDGVAFYESGRSFDAEQQLTVATTQNKLDARYWYFLGLARLAQGNQPGAEDAFKTGADLEGRGLPDGDNVGASLERIQGPARQVLAAYRP